MVGASLTPEEDRQAFPRERANLLQHPELTAEVETGGRLVHQHGRNQIKGTVIAVTEGQTTAHVRIQLSHGVVLTSSITNEAVDDLGLKPGDAATAIIKASDVMVGK